MKMQFREYRKQDYRDLVEIIRKTWHYDEFCSPKTANKLANVFLSSCFNQLYLCKSRDCRWKSGRYYFGKQHRKAYLFSYG